MSRWPVAAYRLQLRNGTGFAEAAALAPYLAELGASHLHVSPPFKAFAGSTHGYDVVDPNALDPVLGGEPAFLELCEVLRENELGLILDIVPNHMGIGPDNAWWWSVLGQGAASPHAGIFDLSFDADPDGKLVLPVLGKPAEEAVEAGELKISADRQALAYFDQHFPLAEGSLDAAGDDVRKLLAAQPYRLVHWREGASTRNYRRFFDVDGLVGVRVEDPEVFEATHRLILELLAKGLVQGLRVDHVDGLADPAGYLQLLSLRANEAAGKPVPIWVEKILVGDEKLPAEWPVAGTTGYEFAALVTRILLAFEGLPTLERLRARMDPEAGDFHAVEAAAKRQVLEQLFPGELASLVHELAGLLGRPQVAVREAVEALIVAFPVYRTYLRADGEPGDVDRRVLARATSAAAPTLGEPAVKVLDQLSALLTGPLEPEVAHLATRLQQLTGPAMAKSVEDTAFYRFPLLLALNEVGGSPVAETLTDEEAHRLLAERGSAWPQALLATSTHDTKRGEDARARLLVLAELPAYWAQAIERWRWLNTKLRPPTLHPLDEASLYQSLVGAWPLALAADDAEGLAELCKRLAGWQQKSLREAKLRSSWLEPNEAYEAAAQDFLASILDPARSPAFLDDVATVVGRLAPAGVANSLAQTLIKLTAPGVPDIYQGGELWDLSLVDPDNRRPVDWALRQQNLRSVTKLDDLLVHWHDGALKQHMIARVLAFRRAEPALFVEGAYLPLTIEGPAQAHAFAFARVLADRIAITLVGRRLAGFIDGGMLRVRREAWGESNLLLPEPAVGRSYREIVSGAELADVPGRIPLSRILTRLPMAFLVSSS